jgi:hypothetical protein
MPGGRIESIDYETGFWPANRETGRTDPAGAGVRPPPGPINFSIKGSRLARNSCWSRCRQAGLLTAAGRGCPANHYQEVAD